MCPSYPKEQPQQRDTPLEHCRSPCAVNRAPLAHSASLMRIPSVRVLSLYVVYTILFFAVNVVYRLW